MPRARHCPASSGLKANFGRAAYQSLGEAVALENAEMFASLQSEDFKEGVAHFQERRPARFTSN
jgi:enoyl-CoA hydratase/carnithine racemase